MIRQSSDCLLNGCPASNMQFKIMNMAKKITKDLLVSNRCGIHLRVGAMLSKTANSFDPKTEITLHKGSAVADCRSVLDLLSLGAFQGDAVILEVNGTDAEEAQTAIVDLFNARFHEDEGDII